VPPAISVFADHDDWAYNDWFDVTRENRANQKRIRELEGAQGIKRTWLSWLARPLMRLGLLK
jgi:hypothetical protein